jgi:hypothetical protein
LQEIATTPDKGNIFQPQFLDHFAAFPYPGTFNIQTNKISAGMTLGKMDCIFSSSAAKFERNGIIVIKKILMPVAFQLKIRYYPELGKLEKMLEREVLGKMQ